MALLGLLLVFLQPAYLRGNPVHLVLLAMAAGVFGAGYFISLYVVQKHVDAGITTLVLNIYTPVAIVLSSIFLSEKLTMAQALGTALLLIGVVVVSKKHRIGRFKFDRYFTLMILSGTMLGVSLVAERALQKMTGFTTGTLFSWWAQCATLGIATLLLPASEKHSAKDTAVTGVLRYFQSLSWVILLLVVGNLSLVSSVTTFKVVVMFVAAAIFLREREDIPRKILGSAIAFAGLLLM
jgi:drug/metabolite transporter (DMT)-like permease